MKALYRYELHKFIFQKKNGVLIILLLLFLTGFIAMNYQKDQAYPEDMKNRMMDYAETARDSAKMASTAAIYLNDPTEIRKLEEEAEFWNKFSGVCSVLQADYSDRNHHSLDFLHKEATWYRMISEGREQGYNTDQITQWNDKTLQEKMKVNQYLIKENLSPLNSPFECNFFNLINLLFSDYYPLVLTMLFLLMVFDICSSEFENGTYKTIYATPVSRSMILKTKFLFMLSAMIVFILLILLVFGIAAIFFGMGSFTYPYLINSVISGIAKADGYLFVIFFSNLLFMMAVLVCLGYSTHSSSLSLAVVIVLYAVAVIYRQVFDFEYLYSYLPVCYIFNKEIIQYQGTWMSFLSSIGCCTALLPITGVYFSRQNLNGSQ